MQKTLKNLSKFPFRFQIHQNFCTQQNDSQLNDVKKPIYDINVAQDYIYQNVKKFDFPTYVIGNYYPSQIRKDFYALNWFNTELMRIPESSNEIALVTGKLEFWNDNLKQIFQDTPIKEPVSICLHHACKKSPISKALLQKLIQARILEANTQQVADITQLQNFGESIRTTMILLNLQLLRVDFKNDPNVMKAAQHIGINYRENKLIQGCAIGIVDYLRRIPYGLRKYRLYMPQDILQKHSVSVRTLWNRIEGKPKDELGDVVLEVAAFAKMHLEKGKEYQDKLPPQAFRAFLHAVEVEYYLEQLEKYNFDVFNAGMNAPSYITVPIRVFKASRNKKFTVN